MGVVAVIAELGGGWPKGTSDGDVERIRAGDNKDKLAKDVSGEMEGGIEVISGESKC